VFQGWSTKDLMTLLGVESKKGKKITDPVLIDFLQFIDAVIEVHGDPFYELRYRCGRVLLLDVCDSSYLCMPTLAAPDAGICSV
jgi:hypothetical protein